MNCSLVMKTKTCSQMKGKYLITDTNFLTDKHRFRFAIVYNRELHTSTNLCSSLDQKNTILEEQKRVQSQAHNPFIQKNAVIYFCVYKLKGFACLYAKHNILHK